MGRLVVLIILVFVIDGFFVKTEFVIFDGQTIFICFDVFVIKVFFVGIKFFFVDFKVLVIIISINIFLVDDVIKVEIFISIKHGELFMFFV